MDYQALVNLVGVSRYREACAVARADSSRADYGRGATTLESELPVELFDHVWDSEFPHAEKIELVFRLFDEMPCYSYLFSLKLQFASLASNDKVRFWDWVRSMLSSHDPAFVSPVTYPLWCDFFEDPKIVDEAWAEVTRTDLPDAVLKLVLIDSGPVPFRLKQDLYAKLLPNEQWHDSIFRSLLHSAFDVFGNIDEDAARLILSQLILPPEMEYLDELRAWLSMNEAT